MPFQHFIPILILDFVNSAGSREHRSNLERLLTDNKQDVVELSFSPDKDWFYADTPPQHAQLCVRKGKKALLFFLMSRHSRGHDHAGRTRFPSQTFLSAILRYRSKSGHI